MQSLQEKLNHDYSLVEIKQDCITNCMLWSSRNIEIWSARIRRRIYRWVLGSPKSHFFWFDLFGVEPLCTYELVGGDIFFHITEPINRFLGAHHATQPFQEIPWFSGEPICGPPYKDFQVIMDHGPSLEIDLPRKNMID